MGPSDKTVLAAIKSNVQNLFRGLDRDELTVNNVRSRVEAKLQLDPSFLKTGSWKQKSKECVKAEYDRLLELEEAAGRPHSNQSTPVKVKASKKSKPDVVKKPAKRASDGDKGQPRKRHKKQETPVSEQGDSELTSIKDTPEDSEDSYASEAPTRKKQRATPKTLPKSAPKQRQKNKVDSHHATERRAKQRLKGSTTVAQSNQGKKLASKADPDDNNSDLSEVETPDLDLDSNGKAVGIDGSDSDMSVVLDEPLKRKKQPKSASTTKSFKNPKIAKPSVEVSPDEVEIKTLQTQLTKCGIRKIWGIVLKPYGTDSKAKIKYLKGMLKDAGMEGRFSEARAREIKEARELMADLEAVKEGEASWGMGRESRTKKTREKMKNTKDSYSHGVGSDMEARSRSISEEPEPRIARAKLDLAFLGDESDSDD